ncbi:MAG TPA: alpha/beta hydrolase-fold protein [Planctomycetota bacterium]|nr:alpha/beta hydrolase-fold protein [Planctomycetota bacterium]
MAFRTVEVSDPFYERDHLRHVTVKSTNLKGRGDLSVFVPPGCDKQKLPIVILLHGVYGSHWAWAYKGGAHATALKLIQQKRIRPMVLAMPSDGLWGDGSGYLPHASADYERWIIDDVPAAACEAAPNADPKTFFISGLSMGGYGALRLGGKYPDRFRGISGHSSITQLEQLKHFVEEPLASYGPSSPEEQCATRWLIANKQKLPPLRFDCGRDDILLDANRKLHRDLEAAGVPHTYDEFSGAHTWPYWQEHLLDTLLFFEKCLI